MIIQKKNTMKVTHPPTLARLKGLFDENLDYFDSGEMKRIGIL
jgi:hypothetical protein